MTPSDLERASRLLSDAYRAAVWLNDAKRATYIEALEWGMMRGGDADKMRKEMLEACREIAVRYQAEELSRLRALLSEFGTDLSDELITAHVAEHEARQREASAKREMEAQQKKAAAA